MAQFIGIIDVSAAHRTQFAEHARRELAASYGAAPQVFEHADLIMVSGTRSWEPFHHAQSAHGVSFVWGHAAQAGLKIAAPPDLAQLWRGLPAQMPRPMEGIHAAFLHRTDGSWTAGADILGLMPVYYFCGKDHVVIGSSPELFRTHPDFRAELDSEGLVGILLTNGLVSGRTLLRGVRRLGPGMLLHSHGVNRPEELLQYAPETSDRYAGASFDENYRRMNEVLDDCFDRHLDANSSYGLILSGGLDSRLVAAVTQQHRVSVTAYSFGSPRDIEMKCALGVARSLKLEHRTVPIRMERYLDYAQDECQWQHLANGFSALSFHEPIPNATDVHAGLLSGYAMENVIGADHITWAGEDPASMSFANMFKRINRWAIPIDVLKRLIAGAIDPRIVDDVMARLEQTYNGYAESEVHKAWLFDHYHRDRFHTAAVLGLHSRWPWPVVPFVDTQMLDLIGGMPYEHIEHRRLQRHMLKERFPKLARVPLDRNTFNVKPLVPRYSDRLDSVLFKPRQLFYRWTQGIRDRRYYYRVMDFNSSGWDAVRRKAELYRGKALQVLDETTLDELLPRPGERFQTPDAIIDTAEMKLLTGFFLWSARYL